MLRFVAVVVVAALGAAAPASAAGVSFAYHAWELQSDGARSALHDRMLIAVKGFCMMESRRSLKAFRQEQKCIAEMSDALVARIGDSSLASLHHAGK